MVGWCCYIVLLGRRFNYHGMEYGVIFGVKTVIELLSAGLGVITCFFLFISFFGKN